MESACQKISHSLDHVDIRKPLIPVVSNLTANIEENPLQIKQNLIWQMNHRTLWEASMRFIIGNGVRNFIEFSPGKTLKGMLRKIDPGVETISLSTMEDFHAVE
jgi:[acyl-carrier-protein] S-malonyltransferase